MSDGRPPEKPVEDWVTGDEPMTGPQSSYLATLAREAGVEVPDGLSKADASKMIDELQSRTGRDETSRTSADTDTDTADVEIVDGSDETGPTEFGASASD